MLIVEKGKICGITCGKHVVSVENNEKIEKIDQN